MDLDVMAAGASKGLIDALARSFGNETGIEICGTFSAVGEIAQRALAGEPCDVIVLTAKMIDELRGGGSVFPQPIASLGRVRTAVAVREGEALPDIASAGALRRLFLASAAIYVPDVERSTAGAHVVKVLNTLGIAEVTQPRLRSFSSGTVAMRELAVSDCADAIGCTQASEIISTPGVLLVGALPREFELATEYVAGVFFTSRQPEAARAFIRLLAGDASRELRVHGGFEE